MEDRRGNRMQSASFELLGGASFLLWPSVFSWVKRMSWDARENVTCRGQEREGDNVTGKEVGNVDFIP